MVLDGFVALVVHHVAVVVAIVGLVYLVDDAWTSGVDWWSRSKSSSNDDN